MIWTLTGFMGCGKTSAGRLAATLRAARQAPGAFSPAATLRAGGPRLQEFASLTPPSLRDGPPASVPRVARPSDGGLPPCLPPMQFADLDEEIEIREGRSVREIFASDGEAGFRAIEMRTLESLLREPDVDSTVLLIALGGGTLTDAGSRELVRRHTKCIYLRASAETLAAHLREAGTDGRPLLALKQGETLEGRIRSMLSARSAIYESCADAVADIDGLGIEEIANIINDIIK